MGFHARERWKLWSKPLRADVHYEIVMDDKSVFLLQDIPQISFFANTVVNVEGAVSPGSAEKIHVPSFAYQ